MRDELTQPDDRYGVLLPCTPETFADFVSGLLGAQQTIERRVFAPFELRLHDIENTFHLVNQRVTQQNQASLLQFTAKVYYDDNSSVLLAGMQDLLHYNEVRPLVSTGIHLTWSYLVQFPERPAPEKQQIDVTFRAPTAEDNSSDEIFLSRPRIVVRVATAQIRIAHTARSWGVDLESLLVNHLRSFFVEETPLRKFCCKHSGKTAFLTFVCALVTLLAFTFATSKRFDTARALKAKAALSLAPTGKLDFIIHQLSGPSTSQGLIVGAAAGLSVLVAIVVAVWVG